VLSFLSVLLIGSVTFSGAEKTAKLTDQQMIEVMAVREAAHAIVSYYTKHTVPLYKTTILRRGTNLGQVSISIHTT
jgi:ATP-dependent Zn protease